MTKYQEQLAEQVAKAQKEVRKMKRAVPYIFPEYVNLHSAKCELEQAQENYRAAKAAWDKLGN
jgi:hypothetical protein